MDAKPMNDFIGFNNQADYYDNSLALEQDYNERLRQIKSLYELRLEGFQETLKLIFKQIRFIF